MYAVICKKTGKEISRHENADGIEGIYTPGAYEIKKN